MINKQFQNLIERHWESLIAQEAMFAGSVATMLGVSPQAVYQLFYRGRLPGTITRDGRLVFRRSEVERFAKQRSAPQ